MNSNDFLVGGKKLVSFLYGNIYTVRHSTAETNQQSDWNYYSDTNIQSPLDFNTMAKLMCFLLTIAKN